MWFQSKQNEGSTFYFTIKVPIQPPASPHANTPNGLLASVSSDSETGSLPDPSSIPILLAEDNELNQVIIKRLLWSMGYKDLTIVGNGLEAVEEVRKRSFAIVLMDCMMPVMSGFEATQLIRKEAGEKLTIIALTADAFRETGKKCLDVGMNYVITKP